MLKLMVVAAMIACYSLISTIPVEALDCSVVNSCLINNFFIIKNLLQESSAIQSQQQYMSRNESEARIEKICSAFKPIIDCTGRDAAVQCQFKIGKKGQIFRLYYLVFLCEITVKLRQCVNEMMELRNKTTTPLPCPGKTTTIPPTTSPGYVEKSLCSQQFPDVENQTERYRSGLSTPALPEDPYSMDEEGAEDVASSLLTIGEKCDRLRLYVGCWLHYSKNLCGNQAVEIIQNMYEIYNDLSGRQCSSESPGSINYDVFEQEYVKDYGGRTTPAPCNAEESNTTTRSSIGKGSNLLEIPATSSKSSQGADGVAVVKKNKRSTTPAFETYEDSELYKDHGQSALRGSFMRNLCMLLMTTICIANFL